MLAINMAGVVRTLIKLLTIIFSIIFITGCVSYSRASCLHQSHVTASYFPEEYLGKQPPLKQTYKKCVAELKEAKGKPKSTEIAFLEIEKCVGKTGWRQTIDLRKRKHLCLF